MKTYHVGGINPINRCKTLQEAINKTKDDDKIIIHKTIKESVTVNTDIIIDGNNNKFHVDHNQVGISANKKIVISNIEFITKTRSNALNLKASSTLTNIKTKLVGPVREFYPVMYLHNGKHVFNNCTLNNITALEDTKCIFNNCTLYNYYGSNIHLSQYNECSNITGLSEFNNCNIEAAYLEETTINNSNIGTFVIINDAVINNSTFIQKNTPERVNLKKEQEFELLSTLSDRKYCLKVNHKCDIYNYNTNIENYEYLVVYGDNCTININNTEHNNNTQSYLINSAIKFTNTNDNGFWNLNKTKFSKVRSTINTNATTKSGMEKLDELIGLESVKRQIKTIANNIIMNQQSTNKNFNFSYHMVFAGDPGVGKTTVGKLISEILYEIGAIPENKFTEANVDALIKGYVGQTAENTKRILDNALGGVLFIDEAYQLTIKDGQNSFNSDALTVLIRYMEEHRDNLVVIAAGYSKEMKEFLASNIGLGRRFTWIEFEDYSASDMYKIFELMRKANDVEYDNFDSKNDITTIFNNLIKINLQTPDTNGRVTNGGNGGLVRNVFQNILQERNNRVVEQKSNNHNITREDVLNGYKKELLNIRNKQII